MNARKLMAAAVMALGCAAGALAQAGRDKLSKVVKSADLR